MTKQRVQVRDLEAPERIQPAPVKSDIYSRPAAPVEDESLKALERGLGAFASGIGRLAAAQHTEEKKRLTDEQLANFEKWKAGTSSTEQLDAIRAGKLPMQSDLIYDQVVVQHYGNLEANTLAGEIDAERQSGRIPFGADGFKLDEYVREKAAPYVERISGRDARSMIAFGRGLTALRGALAGEHEKIRGELATKQIEDTGHQAILQSIQSGAANGLSPQQVTDGLRKLYSEIGPRAKKGSLDLSYGKMDELQLQALETLAKDPRYAAHAFALLDTERMGVDGETPMGPISKVYRHADKVAAIRAAAVKTLSTTTEAQRKEQVLAADIAAFERGDGTFATIVDHKEANPVDLSKSISISAADRREEAVRTWLQKVRNANGGKRDFEAEFGPLMNNGIKHPEYGRLFQEAFHGILNTNVTAPGGADQLAKVQEVTALYSKIADRNWPYAQTLVSGDAGKFFETYRTLTRFAGMVPEQAASATVAAFSSAHAAKDPQIAQGRRREIDAKIANLDYSRWPILGGIVNRGHVREILETTAEALARVDGVDADTAIERAVEHIKSKGTYINNRVVFAPGIQPDDAPHVQPLLDAVFQKNADYFKERGIKDGAHLSLWPAAGTGKFAVVEWDKGPVMVPTGYDDKGRPIGLAPAWITSQDIQAVRAAGVKRDNAEGVETLKRRLEAKETFEKWAPDNLLRKLFGYGPVQR